MEFLILWLILAAIVAIAAAALGRSGAAWLVLSIVCSPLVGLLMLALVGRRRRRA